MASNVVQTGRGNILASSKRKKSSTAGDRDFAVERIAATARTETLRFFQNRIFSIVLTGSLARHEGTIVTSNGERQVAGDAEFLAIFSDGASLPGKKLMEQLCRSIEEQLLSESIRCSVHVSVGHPSYLSRMTPHIFGYELRTCGRVVSGDLEILELIPKFSSHDVPREDGWRLLSNRMVEHLELAAGLPAGEYEVPERLAYHTVKMLLDMVTSLTVFLGVYEPSYRQRQSRLETILPTLSSGTPTPFPMDCDAFVRDSSFALQKKLESDSSPQINWDLWARMVSYAAALWQWELLELGSMSSFRDLVKVISKRNRERSLSRRLRCWLPLVRANGWFRSVANAPRWRSMFAEGSPRDHTYLAAYQLFSKLRAVSIRQIGDSVEDAELAHIARFLPIRSYQPEQKTWGAWRRLAGDIAHNFHQFVENTTT